LIDTTPKRILFEVKKICLSICSSLPLAGAAAILGILLFGKYFSLSANAHFLFALVLLIGLVIIARTLDKRLRGRPNQDMVAAAIGVSAFIIVNIGVAQPVNQILESARPFAEQVKLLEKERSGNIVFYQIGPDTEDIKFMVNYDKPITPFFIKSPDELLQCPKTSYFITMKQSFDNLPDDLKKQIKLCINGRIGHRDSVVFTLEQS